MLAPVVVFVSARVAFPEILNAIGSKVFPIVVTWVFDTEDTVNALAVIVRDVAVSEPMNQPSLSSLLFSITKLFETEVLAPK